MLTNTCREFYGITATTPLNSAIHNMLMPTRQISRVHLPRRMDAQSSRMRLCLLYPMFTRELNTSSIKKSSNGLAPDLDISFSLMTWRTLMIRWFQPQSSLTTKVNLIGFSSCLSIAASLCLFTCIGWARMGQFIIPINRFFHKGWILISKMKTNNYFILTACLNSTVLWRRFTLILMIMGSLRTQFSSSPVTTPRAGPMAVCRSLSVFPSSNLAA